MSGCKFILCFDYRHILCQPNLIFWLCNITLILREINARFILFDIWLVKFLLHVFFIIIILKMGNNLLSISFNNETKLNK